MKKLFHIVVGVVVLNIPIAMASSGSPIEISALIKSFLLKSDQSPEWSLGAEVKEVEWLSDGVEAGPTGDYNFRKGTVRVSISKKELQQLGKRIEPVRWEIVMSSGLPIKFGPEVVSIQPTCETTQCEFEVMSSLSKAGYNSQELCKYEVGYLHKTGYKISVSGKSGYLVYNQNFGSGGESDDLELYWRIPSGQSEDWLCAEEKQ